MRILSLIAALALILPSLARADKAAPDRTIKGHDDRVTSLAFSPDGTKLASAANGVLKVWDLKTQKELLKFDGLAGEKNPLRFSAEGKTLVTLGKADNVLVLDLVSGKSRAIAVPNLPGGPSGFDLSPDGTLIALVGRSALRVIDVASGKAKYEYEVHNLYGIPSVAFSPDGTRVATASTDKTSLVIEFATGKILRTFDLKLKGENVRFFHDGKSILTAASDNILRKFNIETGDGAKVAEARAPLLTLDVSNDGKAVMGTLARGPLLISLWDGQVFGDAFDVNDLIASAAISPDGKCVAGGGNEGAIYLWKAP